MKVSLFIPCLVDRFAPQIGVACVKLLKSMGIRVHFPGSQTCCGQPAFNAGHPDLARPLAHKMLRLFDHANLVVCPSGSCVTMVREAYGDLGLDDADLERWKRVRDRIFDLSEFLVRDDLLDRFEGSLTARAVMHHSCHHLRHTAGATALEKLAARTTGLELISSPQAERCCGFGGVFSAKLPELSIEMARDRLGAIESLKPDVVVLSDAGCVLQLRGVQAGSGRPGVPVPIVHYAQLFAARNLSELIDVQ